MYNGLKRERERERERERKREEWARELGRKQKDVDEMRTVLNDYLEVLYGTHYRSNGYFDYA